MRAVDARRPVWPVSGLLLAGLALIAVVGGLSAVSPALALMAVGSAAAAALMLMGRQLPPLFLRLLTILLAGYAFLGRGFAYWGLAPIYVGELLLGIALLTLLVSLRRLRLGLVQTLMLAFMTWGLLRTIPYISSDGLDALRDAVLWIYALFALAISVALRDRAGVDRLVAGYARILPMFLVWVPVAAILSHVFQGVLPSVPGSSIPVLVFKGGDMGVHLAGAAAFLLVGLKGSRARGPAMSEVLLWPLWVIGVVMAGAINRGGLVSAGIGLGVGFMLRPSRRWVPLLGAGIITICLLALVNPTIDIGRGQERSISIGQIGTNLVSLVSDNGHPVMRGTEQWRLRFWDRIIDYTIHGPYFWTGKGFGINLADDAGMQVAADHSVRSPHNGHLTVLARMGVPGLTLWILLQSAVGLQLLSAFVRARRHGDSFWVAVDAWLLACWIAMLANASFDPYLEGPQGGIWFWSLIGIIIAVVRIQRTAIAQIGNAPVVRDQERLSGDRSRAAAQAECD